MSTDQNILSNETVDSRRPNPYRGHSPFQAEDVELFFGRERLTHELYESLNRLNEQAGEVRLLSIIGPSGAGKSSLARAGLLGQLRRRPLSGARLVREVVFAPGKHPIVSLAHKLSSHIPKDSSVVDWARSSKQLQVEKILYRPKQGKYDGLCRVIAELPDIEQQPVVVLVDEFDEIYTQCQSAEERNAFVELLLCAAQDPARQVAIVLTLRSDFLGEVQSQTPRFYRYLQTRSFFVPAMSPGELRTVITGPAEVMGVRFTEALTNLLVAESYGGAGTLPLLEELLSKIWEGLHADPPVDAEETLHKFGGLGGLLSHHARALYDSMTHEEQSIARSLLDLNHLGGRLHISDATAGVAVLRKFAQAGVRVVTLEEQMDGRRTIYSQVAGRPEHWEQLWQWLAPLCARAGSGVMGAELPETPAPTMEAGPAEAESVEAEPVDNELESGSQKSRPLPWLDRMSVQGAWALGIGGGTAIALPLLWSGHWLGSLGVLGLLGLAAWLGLTGKVAAVPVGIPEDRNSLVPKAK